MNVEEMQLFIAVKKSGLTQTELSKKIEGITVIDEYTIQIDLLKPEPNLIYFLSMNFITPVPRELVVKYRNDLSQVLVGTGAYYLKSHTNESYSFLKNTFHY